MRNLLLTPDDAASLVQTGVPLIVAGAAALMEKLPRGNWIGGTTPYFITALGGITTETHLFCTVIDTAADARIVVLAADALETLAEGRYRNGFTCLLIPAYGETHRRYALQAATLPRLFAQPVIGWVAGINLAGPADQAARVFDGSTLTAHADAAVVLHVSLPDERVAMIDIINPFDQGDGPAITFPETGFAADACFIDGQPSLLAEHMARAEVSPRLPLVADYAGAMVNVAIRSMDDDGMVHLFAPVMAGQTYRFARPLADYAAAFSRNAPTAQPERALACNCVLNFLYAELEGKTTGGFVGPVTFGEIAYILLTQTLVTLWTEPAGGVRAEALDTAGAV